LDSLTLCFLLREQFWLFDGRKSDESPFQFTMAIKVHEKSVNAVRFSPNGYFLASASDDGTVTLMHPIQPETWISMREEKHLKWKKLRGHTSDVSDVAWSKDSKMLISGAIDGSVLLWNARTLKLLQTFSEHGHFVQGLCWDPFSHFFASCSADRTIKIFRQKAKRVPAKKQTGESALESIPTKNEAPPKFEYKNEINKRKYPDTREKTNGDGTKVTEKITRTHAAFMDDSVPTMVRRLCWSPDGSLLFAPTAQYKASPTSEKEPTTYAYLRGKWDTPVIQFPGPPQATVGIRCSPNLFTLLENGPKPWLDAPYRMLLAVISLDSVFIYDTQHRYPIAAAEQLHFAQLTDACWMPDGLSLVVSSRDGYCSVILLEEQEVGKPLPKDKLPEVIHRAEPDSETPEVGFIEAPTSSTPVVKKMEGSNSSSAVKRKISPHLVQPASREETGIKDENQKKRRIIPEEVVA